MSVRIDLGAPAKKVVAAVAALAVGVPSLAVMVIASPFVAIARPFDGGLIFAAITVVLFALFAGALSSAFGVLRDAHLLLDANGVTITDRYTLGQPLSIPLDDVASFASGEDGRPLLAPGPFGRSESTVILSLRKPLAIHVHGGWRLSPFTRRARYLTRSGDYDRFAVPIDTGDWTAVSEVAHQLGLSVDR